MLHVFSLSGEAQLTELGGYVAVRPSASQSDVYAASLLFTLDDSILSFTQVEPADFFTLITLFGEWATGLHGATRRWGG